MNSKALIFLGFILIIKIFIGCETGHNQSITGDYLNRDPGKLKGATAKIESITPFIGEIGESQYTFAGKYNNVSAFTVMKFTAPSEEIVGTVDSAIVKINVGNFWKDGLCEFELFETTTDWSDSSRLNKDNFIPTVSDPISYFSNTAGIIDSLYFHLTQKTINNIGAWAFIVKGKKDESETLALLYSRYSNYTPVIEFFFKNKDGVSDTAEISCIETNYYFDTGFDFESESSDFSSIISDADGRSAVMKISIPDSVEKTNIINMSILKMRVSEKLVPPGDSLKIEFGRLTAPLVDVVDAQTESMTSFNISINEYTTEFEIDITNFVEYWHQNSESNYGIYIKPQNTGYALYQLKLLPENPFTIFYTSLPEVE